MIWKILGNPFPTNTPDRYDLRLPIFIGLLIYFILAVLEPFGTDQSITPNKSLRLIGHGLIVAIVVYLYQNILPQYFSNHYKIQGWTLGKSIIHGISGLITIGIGMYLYTELVFPNDPATPDFVDCMRYTFIIGVIPSFFILGWNYINFLKRDIISPSSNASSASDLMGILTTDIILCVAQGNYVQVYYEDQGKLNKQMLRKTLAALNEDLSGNGLLRCHRSYIVNMHKVVGQEGNSKRMKLILSGMDKKVKVSRQYVPAMRQWFEKGNNLKISQ